MNTLNWAIEYIKNLFKEKPDYTGRIEINCFKGGISNINKLESIKPQYQAEKSIKVPVNIDKIKI